jgi:hypothetical protein
MYIHTHTHMYTCIHVCIHAYMSSIELGCSLAVPSLRYPCCHVAQTYDSKTLRGISDAFTESITDRLLYARMILAILL